MERCIEQINVVNYNPVTKRISFIHKKHTLNNFNFMFVDPSIIAKFTKSPTRCNSASNFY